jgi:hypothetical protein
MHGKIIMAKYRPVVCQFWNDPDIEKLSPEAKLLFLFLCTNDSTTESGIYEISDKRIMERTGLSKEKLLQSKEALGDKVVWDNDVVFVRSFLKRNSRGRPELIELSIINDIKSVKSSKCWQDFVKSYQDLKFINKIKELIKSYQVFTKTSIGLEIDMTLKDDLNLEGIQKGVSIPGAVKDVEKEFRGFLAVRTAQLAMKFKPADSEYQIECLAKRLMDIAGKDTAKRRAVLLKSIRGPYPDLYELQPGEFIKAVEADKQIEERKKIDAEIEAALKA